MRREKSLTNEQQKAVNAVMNGYNIIVNSVAGSGKTTVSLEIAKKVPGQFLLLTYNRKLKVETKQRVTRSCINNVYVTNYHSFCIRFYGSGKDDTEIRNVIINNTDPMLGFSFDYIIIDEAQDMTELYYFLVRKIINDNKKKIKSICVLGDKRQLLYDYKGADYRFLTKANECYNIDKIISKKWSSIDITESFRVSIEMANFINRVMFDQEIIRSNKHSNILPKYIVYNSWDETKTIVEEILSLILTENEKYYARTNDDYRVSKGLYKPEDIAILARRLPRETSGHSLTTQMKTLVNIYTELQRAGIPINIPIMDSETSTYDYAKGKLSILTFHQSKGIERKVVFVFGFDKSYESKGKETICPNTLYVAATRAIQRLYFIHEKKNDYLSFLDTNRLKEESHMVGIVSNYCYAKYCRCLRINGSWYCQFHCSKMCSVTDNGKECIYTTSDYCQDCDKGTKGSDLDLCFMHQKDSTNVVTNLLRHIDDKTVYKCLKYIDKIVIKNALPGINKHINGPGYFGKEPLYDILGTIIPMYYFYKEFGITKEINSIKYKIKARRLDHESGIEKIKRIISKFESNELVTFKELFRLYHFQMLIEANNGHDFRHKQIKTNELSFSECLDTYLNNLASLSIGDSISVEEPVNNGLLRGKVDCIDNTNKIIYEIKCRQSIDDASLIQIALYNFILMNYRQYTNYKYRIVNINTSEIIEIVCNDPKKVFDIISSKSTNYDNDFSQYSDMSINDCMKLSLCNH